MQTKSGFMDDRDESGEYRDYDDVGQTEKKRRWGQIFIIIRTQVVHADSDIDQDILLFKHLNFSSCFTTIVPTTITMYYLSSCFPPHLIYYLDTAQCQGDLGLG